MKSVLKVKFNTFQKRVAQTCAQRARAPRVCSSPVRRSVHGRPSAASRDMKPCQQVCFARSRARDARFARCSPSWAFATPAHRGNCNGYDGAVAVLKVPHRSPSPFSRTPCSKSSDAAQTPIIARVRCGWQEAQGSLWHHRGRCRSCSMAARCAARAAGAVLCAARAQVRVRPKMNNLISRVAALGRVYCFRGLRPQASGTSHRHSWVMSLMNPRFQPPQAGIKT